MPLSETTVTEICSMILSITEMPSWGHGEEFEECQTILGAQDFPSAGLGLQ